MNSIKDIDETHLKDVLERLLERMLQSGNVNIIGESKHVKSFLGNRYARFDKKLLLNMAHLLNHILHVFFFIYQNPFLKVLSLFLANQLGRMAYRNWLTRSRTI